MRKARERENPQPSSIEKKKRKDQKISIYRNRAK